MNIDDKVKFIRDELKALSEEATRLTTEDKDVEKLYEVADAVMDYQSEHYMLTGEYCTPRHYDLDS